MPDRTILLEPLEMTPEGMERLETCGLITRLRPGAHGLPTLPGETRARSIYESRPEYGPHKLITVTVNRAELAAFGTHPENEEFLLIGEPDARPLFLVVALHPSAELKRRAADGALSARDFTALRVRYNDPQASFFVMHRDVPHGECAAAGPGKPPSFYVTESRDLPLDRLELPGYRVEVRAHPVRQAS